MDEGLFITFEGTDGSGKTSQINFLKEYLSEKGFSVVLTREPGGTNIGEQLREIILDNKSQEMGVLTELLLYASARAQLVHEVIKPALSLGKVVICDRFIDSNYAYQGFGRGIDLKTIADVNRTAIDEIAPDITFFLDVSPEVALCRRLNSSVADRIESEKMDFHMKVYNGYLSLVALFPDRIKSIDGDRSKEEIFEDIKEQVEAILE